VALVAGRQATALTFQLRSGWTSSFPWLKAELPGEAALPER